MTLLAWVEIATWRPRMSGSTRTRPEPSSWSRMASCSANGPAISRTAPPTSSPRPSRRMPRRSAEAISASTTPRGTGCGTSAHHQSRDAEGAVDAAPLVAVEIERNEQIAREKRRLDGAQLARVPHRLVALWHEGAEILVVEIALRAPFGKGQGVHRIPALAGGKADRRVTAGFVAVGFRAAGERRVVSVAKMRHRLSPGVRTVRASGRRRGGG